MFDQRTSLPGCITFLEHQSEQQFFNKPHYIQCTVSSNVKRMNSSTTFSSFYIDKALCLETNMLITTSMLVLIKWISSSSEAAVPDVYCTKDIHILMQAEWLNLASSYRLLSNSISNSLIQFHQWMFKLQLNWPVHPLKFSCQDKSWTTQKLLAN